MHSPGFWWRATRGWSFPATLVPVLLGSFAAAAEGWAFRPVLFGLALAGTLVIHAAANMLNDVDDFRHQVDREGTLGGSGLLQEGALPPEQLRRYALGVLAGGCAIGLGITLAAGIGVLWIGLAGCVSVLVYTTFLRLKYRALGDLQIFLTFGPAVALGAWYVQTSGFSWRPILQVVPVALLTAAILHANNLRDLEDDRKAGIKTLAMLLGAERSRGLYALQVWGSYAAAVLLMIFDLASPWALLVLLTLPLARRNVGHVRRQEELDREAFSPIDGMTAQHNLAFGGLLSVSYLLSLWI